MSDIEPQPQPGGGWTSGPCTDPPQDQRPAFNPAFLLVEIRRVLAEHGVTTDPTPGMLHVTTIACGDVLRGLGVDPVSAPWRPR